MKKLSYLLVPIFLVLMLSACVNKVNEKYIFFLHNRFLENHSLLEEHPDHGRVEYKEILSFFRGAGFMVLSEQREGDVNARAYAEIVVGQIDSLIELGVKAKEITVIGTSKGGYIAQYISTIANNSELNFVFVASFRDEDIEQIPEINYCGRILNIYEKTDHYGVSAQARYDNSSCGNTVLEELELYTGLGHRFLFKADSRWLRPCILWASGVSLGSR